MFNIAITNKRLAQAVCFSITLVRVGLSNLWLSRCIPKGMYGVRDIGVITDYFYSIASLKQSLMQSTPSENEAEISPFIFSVRLLAIERPKPVEFLAFETV